jgi:hypothetical protein
MRLRGAINHECKSSQRASNMHGLVSMVEWLLQRKPRLRQLAIHNSNGAPALLGSHRPLRKPALDKSAGLVYRPTRDHPPDNGTGAGDELSGTQPHGQCRGYVEVLIEGKCGTCVKCTCV